MPDLLIQIGRDNLPLGTLPAREAVELLEVGFLQPNDWWHPVSESPAVRRPMSEVRGAAAETGDSDPKPAVAPTGPTGASSGSWLERTRLSLTTAAGSIAHSVEDVAGRLKSLGARAAQTPSTVTNKLLDGYLPQIRNLAQSVISSPAMAKIKSGMRDDEFMKKVFGAVYDCLPKPITRFVAEDRFIGFCMTHRSRLLSDGNTAAAIENEESPPRS